MSLEDLTTRVEDTEQLIARCVADAGFDYVAVDFVTIKQAMDSDETAPGLSDDAYLAQYGLGITTQFDKPLVVFGAGPQNSAYLAGLPESDQVAFRRALWGEAADWNHARALEEEDFSQTGGCTRAAADQLYSAGELSGTYINPADRLVEQDPRMIDAITAWSDCMTTDGYDYTHPDQVADGLTQRLDVSPRARTRRHSQGPTSTPSTNSKAKNSQSLRCSHRARRNRSNPSNRRSKPNSTAGPPRKPARDRTHSTRTLNGRLSSDRTGDRVQPGDQGVVTGGPRTANQAPCGSVAMAMMAPPGTSIGPCCTAPPAVSIRSIAAAVSSTPK